MNEPTIGVLIANYNHGHYLRQCFAGLLQQTYRDFAVYITDDGSTDNSRAIIEEFAARDARFQPHYFPANQGLKKACANLFGRSAGRYLYSGAADDFIISKDFFRLGVEALDSDPRPAGFYGITGIYLAEEQRLVDSCGTAAVEGYNTPLQCGQGFIRCQAVVTSPSCLFRRDLFMGISQRDNDQLFDLLGPQVDFYVNHALAFQHGMVYRKLPFACQRIFAAKTNYSANTHLWQTAARYAEMERRLRAIDFTYPGIEADWLRWRAFWMLDTVKKTGHLQLPAA